MMLGILLCCAACRPEQRATTAATPTVATQDTTALRQLRAAMVEEQLAARGITDTAVLRAMLTVPRHRFVPPELAELAYTSDGPLPIGQGQTISQPYIVAYMAEAAHIQPGDRVLEIGTGSGYGAAVLAALTPEVYSVEIRPDLAQLAGDHLNALGYRVAQLVGNGWLGWPEHAPYDAIVVTAAPDEIPAALVEQLAVGGRLVIPVGTLWQDLRVLEKTASGLRELARLPVQFVPLIRQQPDTTGG